MTDSWYWEAAAGEYNLLAHLMSESEGIEKHRVLKVPNPDLESQDYSQIEEATLDIFSDYAPPSSLMIPRILKRGTDPRYLVLSYVPGDVYLFNDSFSDNERLQIGRDI